MSRPTALALVLPDDGPWTVGHVTLTPKGAAPYSPPHDLRTNGDLVLAPVPVGDATLDLELRRKGERWWRRIEREIEVEVKSGGTRVEMGQGEQREQGERGDAKGVGGR